MTKKTTKGRLAIKYVDPNSLQPAAYNPRSIDEASFAGLRESLKKFGLVDPILVNARTGNIVGGHQRLKAAIANQEDEVPTIELDLSEAEEKALNLTLNNPNIAGRYTDAVNDLLAEIRLDLGDDGLRDLRLDTLELRDWDSDIEKVDKTNAHTDGIQAVIKVTCPQEAKDEVRAFLMEALATSGFEGVNVE